MSALDDFKRNKRFAVCVDSDGCAMDTMNIKHYRCFGPCMVEEWGLEPWRDAILALWNVINLYSGTRGINRFKGLAMALGEIDQQYTPIDGVEALIDWAGHAPELSNDAVAKNAAEHPIFEKALRTDYTRQLKFIHDTLGIQRVRFHGIFCDDMRTVNDLSMQLDVPGAEAFTEYNFGACGIAYDNVLSAGMKPLVELSFMPEKLALKEEGRPVKGGFFYRPNIVPPADYAAWRDYLQAFVRFLIHRYGAEEVRTWLFECSRSGTSPTCHSCSGTAVGTSTSACTRNPLRPSWMWTRRSGWAAPPPAAASGSAAS